LICGSFGGYGYRRGPLTGSGIHDHFQHARIRNRCRDNRGGRDNRAGVRNGERHRYGANLAGADLSGADLDRPFLHNADLAGANLSGAYLITSWLTGANLDGTNLAGAELGGSFMARTCSMPT
jgi:uncharacterized protein YjbI with pentapeptide repeats